MIRQRILHEYLHSKTPSTSSMCMCVCALHIYIYIHTQRSEKQDPRQARFCVNSRSRSCICRVFKGPNRICSHPHESEAKAEHQPGNLQPCPKLLNHRHTEVRVGIGPCTPNPSHEVGQVPMRLLDRSRHGSVVGACFFVT